MNENLDTLGNYLKREREQRKISLEQISYATRISIKMLRALEEDDHESLPAQPFVRGYLQAYAKVAHLDPQDLLLRYQHYLATNPKRSDSKLFRSGFFRKRELASDNRHSLTILGICTVLLLLVGLVYFVKARKQRHQVEITKKLPVPTNLLKDTAPPAAIVTPAVTPLTPAVSAPAAVNTPPPSPSAAAIKAPALPNTGAALAPPTQPTKYTLNLKAKEDVWIRYQSDDAGIKDQMLRAGSSITMSANKVIKIFTGNSRALEGSLNGETLETLTVGNRSRSIILPFSEVEHVPLPLFPLENNAAEDQHGAEKDKED